MKVLAVKVRRKAQNTDFADHFFMHLTVAHDAVLSDMLSARLKLWFDQTDTFPTIHEKCGCNRQHQF